MTYVGRNICMKWYSVLFILNVPVIFFLWEQGSNGSSTPGPHTHTHTWIDKQTQTNTPPHTVPLSITSPPVTHTFFVRYTDTCLESTPAYTFSQKTKNNLRRPKNQLRCSTTVGEWWQKRETNDIQGGRCVRKKEGDVLDILCVCLTAGCSSINTNSHPWAASPLLSLPPLSSFSFYKLAPTCRISSMRSMKGKQEVTDRRMERSAAFTAGQPYFCTQNQTLHSYRWS